ncbi:MAG: adenosylcobalamin-dependent ribonucleoside-diphosphate reductase [Planctomycetota bacterium]|jgi:ribonucleoside-diphosphate reductase alpha chain
MVEPDIFSPPGLEPELSENALKVLEKRYLLKDKDSECIETPAQLFSRVATLVAEAEPRYGGGEAGAKEWHRRFYDLMATLKFLPNSPALMNAKRRNGMLSACFVLPIEDSIEAIFETVKQTALIQKAGGGTGFSLDNLRPTGDLVESSGGTTSGPISFWKVFSETTNAIQQGAYRRGANMGMMSVEHPDILKFLHAKKDLNAFTNFNTSVKICDSWMKSLLKGGDELHVVMNPRTQEQYLLPRKLDIENYTIHNLVRLVDKPKQKTEAVKKFYTVKDIWQIIVKCAHETGEPGLAFIDRINRDNPTPTLGKIEGTNPCGEQPLLPYEACTLGSINLAKFVKFVDGNTMMDWTELGKVIELSVRFLDNILDVSEYPVRETVRLAQANRKIGLGIMGFADCLFMMGIPYDSDEGVGFGEQVMHFIEEKAHEASVKLANMRGPFPNWNDSIWRTERSLKIRNAAVTCVAPTGTISIIADCSSGIEPSYSLVFYRQVLAGAKLLQVNPVFKKIAEEMGFFDEKLVEQIAKKGSIQGMSKIPSKIRKIFKCAYDIKPEGHIRMQAAFQRNCDAAVSKTINLPKDVSVAAVDKGYKMAYELGCKGITVYRKGSREGEPMCIC